MVFTTLYSPPPPKVHPRGFAGELSVLSKMPSFVTVRSKTKAIVLRIPNAAMQELMDLYPSSVACLAQYLLRRVSPLVRRIDFALDWQHVEAGKPIYRQGSVAESAFIILNGRCRSVVRRDNGHKEVGGPLFVHPYSLYSLSTPSPRFLPSTAGTRLLARLRC